MSDVEFEFDCDALSSCPVFQESSFAAASSFVDQASASARDMGDYADDATWVLTSSFVILTMQSGFGLLEMGSSMPGNEVHIMVKNVVDVVFGSLSYWLLGYGISYGSPSIPFMGLGDFAPTAGYNATASGLKFSEYIFQFSFAATSTTIVSGCIAMRTRFVVYCAFSFFAIIFYAFAAHWVWAADGWLRTLGMYDFAGGGPVHLFGGTNGLIAIIMIGPRTGLFDGTRPSSVFRPVSPASQLFGLFMLWWGWIGFNCGSTFGITGSKWVVATRAAINTINSTAGGGLTAMLYSLFRTNGKLIKVHHLVNGILGSLVATSPTCSVVNTYESLFIGALGALVSNWCGCFLKRLHLDDPVNAVGVHAAGAIWGLVAVGIFADGQLPGVEVRSGLLRGGGMELLGFQVVGIISIMCWSVVCSLPFFYICGLANSKNWRDPRKGLRVTVEEEIAGADKILHGVEELSVYDHGEVVEFDDASRSQKPSSHGIRSSVENDKVDDFGHTVGTVVDMGCDQMEGGKCDQKAISFKSSTSPDAFVRQSYCESHICLGVKEKKIEQGGDSSESIGGNNLYQSKDDWSVNGMMENTTKATAQENDKPDEIETGTIATNLVANSRTVDEERKVKNPPGRRRRVSASVYGLATTTNAAANATGTTSPPSTVKATPRREMMRKTSSRRVVGGIM